MTTAQTQYRLKKSPGQTSLYDRLIVDCFAGGGGASTGIELALGKIVDIACNHDPAAVRMHKTNHPHTTHYLEDIRKVDPVKACGGKEVDLIWFSPDCKHFSRAKGAALVDKRIRGLAWMVPKWAALTRPRVIILENVPEFVTWGPVHRGKPTARGKGKLFRRFIKQLRELGYDVEWRELVAADYGTPTTRKRLVLIARRDGLPIVFSERTHAPADHPDVISGKLLPWRSAAEIIDWSLPCPSIFDDKAAIKAKHGLSAVRPLAESTMKRVARGLDRFVLKSSEPFILGMAQSGRPGERITSIHAPIRTLTVRGENGLVMPMLSSTTHSTRPEGHSYSPHESMKTIVSKAEQCLLAPALLQYHSEQSEHVRGQNVDRPILTVDASNRYALMSPSLIKYYGQGDGQSVATPLHTVTAKDREGVNAVWLSKYYAGGYTGAGVSAEEPLPTVTAWDHNSVCAAHMVALRNNQDGSPADVPVNTICANGQHAGVVKEYLTAADDGLDLHRWPEIRAMLNEYCGYTLVDDEILLLDIGGTLWFISDIGLRMLTPRELYAAMGFPPDYKIERDYTDKEYTKSQMVARCGNAVCPPMARAVVAANFPEYAREGLTTMRDLEEVVAA